MELNTFLKQAEHYLTDLSITDRSKILSLLSEQLINEDLSELNPKLITNQKRVELGFNPFVEKKKSSIAGTIIKSMVVLTIVFILFISFLITKFTPLFKVDEENERVTILGGLIDIDAKAGKFIIGDDVQFTDSSYSNFFSSQIALESKTQDIIFNIDSGNYIFSTMSSSELDLDCKFSSPPMTDMINLAPNSIRINLEKRQGSCKVKIPKDKTLIIKAKTAQVSLLSPNFNALIDLKNGNVLLDPDQLLDYDFNFKVDNGTIDSFQSNGTNSGYKMHFNLKNGSVKQYIAN